MTSAYNGRIDAAQRERNLQIAWNGGIYDLDYWTILKGAKDQDGQVHRSPPPRSRGRATPQHQLRPDQQQGAGQARRQGAVELPTSPANSKDALQFNIKFWADAGEPLEKRFASWAAQ